MAARTATTNPLPQVLGAPGVYFAPDQPVPTLVMEPMDVAAFVGVAPRGPAWELIDDPTLPDTGATRARTVPVAVESWDDYVETFGAFEAPSLLPHAVAAYFAQGGRRAWVLRIVHDEIGFEGLAAVPLGCAHHDVVVGVGDDVSLPAPTVRFRARNEGSWGNRLDVTISFSTRPLAVVTNSPVPPGPAEVVLDAGTTIPAGTLLRLRATDGATVLRWASSVRWRGRPGSVVRDLVVALDQSIGFAPALVEQVDAELTVVDRDPERARREHFTELGLQPGHPRWLPAVLHDESRLIEVADELTSIPVNDPTLPPATSTLVDDVDKQGADRWHLVTPTDVFGRLLEGDDSAIEGLDALAGVPEVATIVVPDLYSPAELPTTEPVETTGIFAGPTFKPCLVRPPVQHPAPPALPLTGLTLDPLDAADLDTIVGLQQQLVLVAERLRCVVLLDVPPGLRQRAILRWRSRFDSSFAAAYHPWLRVPTGDGGALIALNPSAVAAGIIARCERRQGVPRGPANEPAHVVVDVTDRVDDDRHADLHQSGIDVFRRQPDAIWLTGARTLSTEREWRQLTVRRLLLLVQRAVAHQLQWVVFEPNDAMLRAGLRRMLDHLLGQLFAQGAFAGATPAQSWFVHVADGRDLRLESDIGQVIVEIGVAPSEPTEFIIVQLSIDATGAVETTLRVGSGVLAS